jgi:endonuclease I
VRVITNRCDGHQIISWHEDVEDYGEHNNASKNWDEDPHTFDKKEQVYPAYNCEHQRQQINDEKYLYISSETDGEYHKKERDQLHPGIDAL